MLRDGARLVIDPDDTALELVELARDQGYDLPDPHASPEALVPELAGDEVAVYAEVLEGSTVDEVADGCSLDPSRTAVVLASLELDGIVRMDDQGRWWRVT